MFRVFLPSYHLFPAIFTTIIFPSLMVEASDDPHNCECKCEIERPMNCSSETRACARKSNANEVSECTTVESADFVSCVCVCGLRIESCSPVSARASARKRRARMSFQECPVPASKRPRTKTFRFFWTARAGVEMKLVVPTWNTKAFGQRWISDEVLKK